MTESQQRALALAFTLLEQEFAHSIIIVAGKEKPGVQIQEDFELCWNGGRGIARTLLSDAMERIKYQKLTRCTPNVSKKVMNEVMKKHYE